MSQVSQYQDTLTIYRFPQLAADMCGLEGPLSLIKNNNQASSNVAWNGIRCVSDPDAVGTCRMALTLHSTSSPTDTPVAATQQDGIADVIAAAPHQHPAPHAGRP